MSTLIYLAFLKMTELPHILKNLIASIPQTSHCFFKMYILSVTHLGKCCKLFHLHFLDLEGRYTEWTPWSRCKSEHLTCNSTGVTERRRTCKTATKAIPGGCVGMNIMKDWCLMPCFCK